MHYFDFNFFTDYEYDLEGNFELGVSFLATMLKKEDINSKVGSRVDIKYEPQVLPRRLEEESSKRMLLPSSATVSTQWAIFAKNLSFKNLFMSSGWYFRTLFWDDITIFSDENLLWFLIERKKKLFWTNKKFVYLIFIPKYRNIIPK